MVIETAALLKVVGAVGGLVLFIAIAVAGNKSLSNKKQDNNRNSTSNASSQSGKSDNETQQK